MARGQDHGCHPQDLSFEAEGDRGILVKGALGFGVRSAPGPDPPAQTLNTFLALSSQSRGVLRMSRYQRGNSHNPGRQSGISVPLPFLACFCCNEQGLSETSLGPPSSPLQATYSKPQPHPSKTDPLLGKVSCCFSQVGLSLPARHSKIARINLRYLFYSLQSTSPGPMNTLALNKYEFTSYFNPNG